MLKSSEDFMREYIIVRDRRNKEYSSERTVELTINIIGLLIVTALVQFFYPPLTIATVVAWVGISIYAKLISIYYVILENSNHSSHYYNDIRLAVREIHTALNNETKNN